VTETRGFSFSGGSNRLRFRYNQPLRSAGYRSHEDYGVEFSTTRSESWAIETSEDEKSRSRKKTRPNRRLGNRGTNRLRRNLQSRVRRRRL